MTPLEIAGNRSAKSPSPQLSSNDSQKPGSLFSTGSRFLFFLVANFGTTVFLDSLFSLSIFPDLSSMLFTKDYQGTRRLYIIACTDVQAEAARKLAEESAEGSAWRHAGKCAMMETTSEPENRTMKLEQENPYEFIADKEHTCTRVMRPG